MPTDKSQITTQQLNALVSPPTTEQRTLRPSSIGAFVRTGQCQRLLRFSIYPDKFSDQIATALDTRLELFPPTMSQAGRRWEREIAEQLDLSGWDVHDCVDDPAPDWIRILLGARSGSHLAILQPTIAGTIGSWIVHKANPDLLLFDADMDGNKRLTIVDLKSTRSVTLEHRLQVALYALLLRELLPTFSTEQAVLHRSPLGPIDQWPDQVRRDHVKALERLGFASGTCLSIADDSSVYERQILRMVSDPGNVLDRVAASQFADLPFHLEAKCDTCRFNPVCVKSAVDLDDLSLIPNLTNIRKAQFVGHTVRTVHELAGLPEAAPARYRELLALPGIGPHLDEAIEGATILNASLEGGQYSTWREHADSSALPGISPELNPELLQITLDVQYDSGSGRIYLASAYLEAHANGAPVRNGIRTVLKLAERPVEDADSEAKLIQAWLRDLMGAVIDLTRNRADAGIPIHIYVWDEGQLRFITELINRQGAAVFALDAVPGLFAQQASFAATHIAVLRQEVRNQRQFPQLCQSLQTLAPHFGYRWSDHARTTFRYQLFDAVTADIDPARDPSVLYRPVRTRFRSSIPTEYAQRAWGDLVDATAESSEPNSRAISMFGHPTLEDILGFQRERIAAMVQIRDGLRTNQILAKEPFRINSLSRIALSRNRPIDAIAAFATMERHAELADWRSARSVRPAGRFLAGSSLPVRYLDSDQSKDIQDLVRHARVQAQAHLATGKRKADMTKDERKAVAWSLEGVTLRMRIDSAELPIPQAQLIAQNPIAYDQRAVLNPLWSQHRTDDSSNRPYPTPAWRLLRGMAIDISSSGGEMLDVTFRDRPWLQPGYGFGALPFVPEHDVSYVVDERPDSETGSRQIAVIQAIKDDRPHAGYAWIAENQAPATRTWSQIAIDAQGRFMAGLDAFGDAVPGAMTWEPEKRRFIGDSGERRMTLVQGPPGTGKSTTTGMAIWARMQGAMAAGVPLRIGLACKTHKATDVLLAAVDNARVRLRDYQRTDEALFAEYFDERIFQVPLRRFAGREASAFKAPDGKSASDRIDAMEQFTYIICAATSHGLGRFVGNQWQEERTIWDLVVLDEASQISIPEFLVATTGLHPNGTMIVVGDHRQMPPIVHTIDPDDPAVAIDPFPVYRSLFDLIRIRDDAAIASIKFSRSFRIHRDVAEFLRRAIYSKDDIAFHSLRRDILAGPTSPETDLGMAIAASPCALVLVCHSEASSQQKNQLEIDIALSAIKAIGALDSEASIGLVVPHRAQRAALRELILHETGDQRLVERVDTVERFQGDERDVIIFSATESDPIYLQAVGGFLFDPRRFNVAISRAKRKLIVVASRELFAALPKDIVELENAEIWQMLHQDICTEPIWQGVVAGYNVECRGSSGLLDSPVDAR